MRTSIGAVVVLVLVALVAGVVVTAFSTGGSATTIPIAPADVSSGTASSAPLGAEDGPGADESGTSGVVSSGAGAGAGTGTGVGAGAGSSGDASPGTVSPGRVSSTSPTVPAPLLVHLVGAVATPGLYELRAGDRVVDAVAAAGGFTPDADQARLNLAGPVSDGEQIFVPRVGEARPVAEGSGVPGVAGPSSPVNLNTADEGALDALPGVGPATAKNILDWREANGRFTAVEDLLSVTGIGEKTLAELRDLVTV